MTNSWRHGLTRLAAAAVSAIAAATIVVATTVASPGRVTVTVRPATVAAGAMLTGTGSGFSPQGAAVQIHLDSTAGPSMWSGRASEDGLITFGFAVPSVAPGNHVVVATQTGSDGDPVPGTPVTVPIRVTPAPTPSASSTPAPPPPTPPQIRGQSVPSTAPPVQLNPSTGNAQAAPTSAPTNLPAPTSSPSTPPPTPAPSLTPASSAPPVQPPSNQSKPPQVLSLWRIGGSVPQVAPTSAPAAPTPQQPPVTLMVLDGSAMGAAVVVIALALKPRHAPYRRDKQRSHDALATLVTRW